MKVTIIGIPIDLGTECKGLDLGPDAFREQKLVEKLSNAGFEVTDEGNIKCFPKDQLEIGNPKLKYLGEIVRISENSAQITSKAIKKGEKVIALGGDHSLCLGVISGASVAVKGELGLIYLDAHGDMNTAKTTKTGNIHGMPLASLMGFGDKQLTNIYSPTTKISKKHMLHIGGNDFEQEELKFIEKEQLNIFKTEDLLSRGFAPLFAEIDKLCKRVKNIWVSLDLDVIDKKFAPGVGMPNKTGLTYQQIITISNYIGQKCNILGVDINEYNPLTDINRKTAYLGIELIIKMLGGNQHL